MKIKKEFSRKAILSPFEFKEGVAIPDEIQILPTGSWAHPMYGPIIIGPEDVAMFKKNFDAKVRRDIPITEGHESFDEKPAIGWFTELMDRGVEGLWAKVDWTEEGKTLLSMKSYKYFSPEFYSEYEDPETHEIYENVLVGGALTNKPYFKELKAVILSEKIIRKFNEQDTMLIEDVVKKELADLTVEEKAFLKEHKAELSAEDATKFESVVAEAPAETDEQKAEREAKEAGDANEAAGLNRDGSAKEPEGDKGGEGEGDKKVEASEVKISASELALLRENADKGVKAFNELETVKLTEATKVLMFSEANKTGMFLPKDNAKVFSFLKGLSEAQRKSFNELMALVPETKTAEKFKEIGAGNGAEGSAKVAIDTKVKALMSEKPTMKYSEALKAVFKENPTLNAEYQAELAGK